MARALNRERERAASLAEEVAPVTINPKPKLVLYGDTHPTSRVAVFETAAAIGVPATCVASPADLARAFDASEPLAVAISLESQGALEACRMLQSRPRLAHVPLLGVTRRRDHLTFLEFLQWGGDDLVDPSTVSLTRRFAPLASRPRTEPANGAAESAGATAVVAGASPEWRGMVVRSLSRAGLPIHHCGSATDAIEASVGARYVIAAADLAPSGAASAVIRAREAGSSVPWLVVAPPKRAPALRHALKDVERVAVVDALGPPDNVLFAANDLASPHVKEARADRRMTYGTEVLFRPAGRDVDDVGFTYNASAGGVYVRTLAPLAVGEEVWLELRVPRGERRLRLCGRVAWKRSFARSPDAFVPAGFGVHLTDGMRGDLERWQDGCAALEHAANVATPTLPFGIMRRPSKTPSQLAPALVETSLAGA
jgi:Tfp pilus assembly protein PilZ